MVAPEDPGAWEHCDAGGVVLYVEPALAGEDEIEFIMPHVGTFTIRRA